MKHEETCVVAGVQCEVRRGKCESVECEVSSVKCGV